VNAYFLVRQQFEILNKIIRERSVTIKTIGDPVMDGFERPQGDCGDAQRPDRLFRTGREYRVRGLTDVNEFTSVQR